MLRVFTYFTGCLGGTAAPALVHDATIGKIFVGLG
jgi:H+/Cl- antiporter ClcA